MARNTGPNAPPQRPGKGAAGARVSPCARRGGWGSAGVVLAPAMAPPRSADSVVRGWWCFRLPAPLSARSTLHLVLGPAAAQSPRCRLSSARYPLPLDPPWSPGGVDQQVLQELPAAEQQVGQGRSGDPGFGHKVPAAVGQGGADLPEFPADVGRHLGSASRGEGRVGSCMASTLPGALNRSDSACAPGLAPPRCSSARRRIPPLAMAVCCETEATFGLRPWQ